MKRIKLIIAYDGTNYCGWQIQPNGITIQEVMTKVASQVLREKITIIGASRTDSGVHALGNVAVFDTTTLIPAEQISHVLNQELPDDIVVVSSEQVPEDFHPRYCESSKTYEYNIVNSRTVIPTKRFTNYFVSFPLDVEQMRKACAYLVGEHDFASFCNVRTNVEDTVRTITDIKIIKSEEDIKISITGNGFLYNMVRIIVGTLIEVGRGFYQPEQMKQMLEAKDRRAAGVTAPAHGLTLVSICYK